MLKNYWQTQWGFINTDYFCLCLPYQIKAETVLKCWFISLFKIPTKSPLYIVKMKNSLQKNSHQNILGGWHWFLNFTDLFNIWLNRRLLGFHICFCILFSVLILVKVFEENLVLWTYAVRKESMLIAFSDNWGYSFIPS